METALFLSRVAVRLLGQVKSEAVLCPRLECVLHGVCGQSSCGPRQRGEDWAWKLEWVGREGKGGTRGPVLSRLGCLGDREGQGRREKWQSGLSGLSISDLIII